MNASNNMDVGLRYMYSEISHTIQSYRSATNTEEEFESQVLAGADIDILEKMVRLDLGGRPYFAAMINEQNIILKHDIEKFDILKFKDYSMKNTYKYKNNKQLLYKVMDDEIIPVNIEHLRDLIDAAKEYETTVLYHIFQYRIHSLLDKLKPLDEVLENIKHFDITLIHKDEERKLVYLLVVSSEISSRLSVVYYTFEEYENIKDTIQLLMDRI